MLLEEFFPIAREEQPAARYTTIFGCSSDKSRSRDGFNGEPCHPRHDSAQPIIVLLFLWIVRLLQMVISTTSSFRVMTKCHI